MSTKYYLTKRKNGYYYIGFFEGNRRKWKTTKCTTKSDALQFLRSFEGTKKGEDASLAIARQLPQP